MENSMTQILCDRQIDLLTDKVIHRSALLLLNVKKWILKELLLLTLFSKSCTS